MKALLVMIVLAVAISISGCALYHAPVMPPAGLLVTSVSAPLDTDMEQTPFKQKKGSSSSMCILWLFSFGNAGIDAAAEDGGLTTIDYADYTYTNIFGVFQLFKTKAYGK
jgi:hypothetical protein